MPPIDAAQAAARIRHYFETLSPAALDRIGAIYTEDAAFKDPFNEVRGSAAIRAIFAHMYAALDEPRFTVTAAMAEGDQVFLAWDFRFRLRRFDTATLQCIRGASYLRLAADGRIREHRDYWDAAEELYEKLPVLGGLLRWLKARART
jgi:ketosteroid isomerase-like protein